MSYRSIAIAALSTALGIAVIEASSAWSAFSRVEPAKKKVTSVQPPPGYLRAKVERILRTDGGPVVLLHPESKQAFLPIWIGYDQARSIARAHRGFNAPRPMTHDLMASALTELDVRVAHVRVDRLRHDGVYIGTVALLRDGEALELDARPSDALALALRVDAPIFVSPSLSERMLSTVVE